ncbi:MAG: Eco57I restriction-modification methylase domain-containing protein, partial [Anaerolineae bacterium]|nr:Eco57I restriction-modification methylase domain-containing protein [Anaerolineae bacterium]
QVHDPEGVVQAILGLNVLDPATGSGHFVVDVTAYIAEWLRDLGLRITDIGEEDELIYWKRLVASACIYAVDINPLAVELAKLSMWLTTLAKGRPLSFLDHHIRVGNSLVGTSVFDMQDQAISVKEEERRRKSLERQRQYNERVGQLTLFSEDDFTAGVKFAVAQMHEIEATIADHVRDVKRQEELYAALTKRLSSQQQAADVWTARYFGLSLTDDQWKAVRQLTTGGMISPAVQQIVDEAERIAQEQRFFHWELVFPEIFFDETGRLKENAGFDAVVGNPPYVRQESISGVKSYLQMQYADVYSGAADIYVYFYAQGLNLLRTEGLLSYITPNKWFSAGYGEGLRGYLAENTHVRQIVDFGHAPIFRGVDTFPMIGVLSKATVLLKEAETEICDFPREALIPMLRQAEQTGTVDLSRYVRSHAFSVQARRFTAESWSLEPSEADTLIRRIRTSSVTLREFIGAAPLYGIKTGYNEAFLISDDVKQQLVNADPGCAEIIYPYLRGQDVNRWLSEWAGLWMILLKSSDNEQWAWSRADQNAEEIFAKTYPSVYRYMKAHESPLRDRKNHGRYWWELNALTYLDSFAQPKIIYQEIQFHPAYAYDDSGIYTNNKCFILPTNDLYLLAVLNSPLMWWHNWRYLTHMKDEALTPAGVKMINLPIAVPSDDLRSEVEALVERQLSLTRDLQRSIHDVLDWLRVEFGVEKAGNKLRAFAELDEADFLEEVRKRSSERLTPAGLRLLRENFATYSQSIRAAENERLQIEYRLSDLVNQAYQLTPEEIDLMWRTAPPRMPIPPPQG